MEPSRPFPFTDEELDAAGLQGEGVSGLVIQVMETMREHPELLDLSLFTLECLNYSGQHKFVVSPTSPTLSKLHHSIASDSTVSSSRYVISDWERTTYYHGISLNHPDLLYRSDLLEHPFPIPKGRFPQIPTKTAYGVFNTPLNTVWDTVAPQIRQLLKTWKIRYSAIKTARFVTHGEDGKETIGPIVIWISTHPTTTTTKNAHDASPDILALLKANGVEGAVVEWYEGAVEKLSGPHLLRIADATNPTHYVRRLLTAALGMPIATTEREGSVALFFHENKDKHGAPSAKVFGLSSCHVLCGDTTVDYEFKAANAPRQHVQLAGLHRFQRGLDEIKDNISGHGIDAEILTREIVELEAKLKSEDLEEAVEDQMAMEAKRERLAKIKKDIGTLAAFYNDTKNQWSDITCRNIGHVHWAPKISVDIQGHSYTRDIGTFEVDAVKFKAQFRGNIVDLGSKFTPHQLTKIFYSKSGGRTTFKWPTYRQLRINGCLTRELLAVPDSFDSNGEPCLIVMKDGNTTDLTVGHYAGLEAYLCDDLGVESIELAIYNYNKQSGSFSSKGDSGSLIFDGEGHMVGILHSGMPKGESNHVTYATPAWWAIEQLMVKYPHADLGHMAL